MFFRSNPVVAVLNLTGVISSSRMGKSTTLNLRALEKVFKKVEDMSRVDAIALAVNCPGGSPVQTEMIYNRIRRLAKTKNVPIMTFVEDCAASGGYWLATAGDTIYASRSSIVGSIGVIAGGFGFVDAMEKLGVERRVYTCGENKGMLDPFQPEKDTDKQILEAAMKDVYEEFCRVVKERRPLVTEESMTGAIWAGAEAKKRGLVDEIGTLEEVLYEKYGADVDIKEIEPDKSLMQRLFGIEGGIVEAAMSVLESRIAWGRVGL
jgi:signal peptide peptidase SppA